MGRVAATIKTFLERPDAERRLGPFLLVNQLGRGGFAPVWLAHEVYGDTVVRSAAVKLFALQRGPKSSGSRRVADAVRDGIVAETSALCKVEHPNVVRFYSLPIDEDAGVMGLAMEHIAGTPLDRRLSRVERLTVSEALALGIAIALALAAVHRAGLVHRDVKPSNVIDADGVYKLIDFGIASAEILRAPDSNPSTPEIIDDLPLVITPARPRVGSGVPTIPLGFQSGTPGYMDPVCVGAREPATAASDLYSLGATLFECLTGKVPAAASARQGTGLDDDVLDGFAPALALGTVAPDVPASLGRVIDTLLSPDRHDRPPSAEWVAARFEEIRGELSAPARALPAEDVGPFRGLGRFEESDRDVYFGRESEIARARKQLRGRGLVTISGASGSGKSSLARAGVLPAIAEKGLGDWPAGWDTAVAEPGRDPRAAVALALDPFVIGAAAMTPDELVTALEARAKKDDRGLILLVDQLEELATLASGESQSWTADLLVAIEQRAPGGVRALAAARRDLLDPLLAMGALGESMGPGLVLIKPITDQVWGDVLDKALAAYDYSFEDDALRSDLLAELEGTAGAMPLVQFALTELWRKRDPVARKVTRKGLEAIGGIAGALERHADATLEAIARIEAGAEESARAVLIAAITPQGTRSTRKLADLERDAGSAGQGVIAALEAARLIVRGPHGVTLAHEALLTQWGRLRGWVAEARQDRLLAEEIERDAERWSGDPDGVPLWPRRRVALGVALHKHAPGRLSAGAQRFLKASGWASLRVWLLVGASVAAVVLSLIGLAYTYVRGEQRSRAAAEEQMRELTEKQIKIDALMERLAQTNNPERREEIAKEILRAGVTPTSLPSVTAAARPTARATLPPAAPPHPSASVNSPPPPTAAATAAADTLPALSTSASTPAPLPTTTEFPDPIRAP
ncbi:MAG: serine/threonine-protein kinase [Byssovorax sp.]